MLQQVSFKFEALFTTVALCASHNFAIFPKNECLLTTFFTAGPHYIELFNQISLHVCSLTPLSSEPASKKRRLDQDITSRPATNGTNGHAVSNGKSTAASSNDPVLLEVKDISVVIPQRKKYTLCFTASHLYVRLPDSKEPVPGISFAWSDIGMSLLLLLTELC
jgi:hypothetical protein